MAQPQQRPAPGVVRFYNFLPEGASFLGEVLAGLAQPRKTLPSRYLYDARGRELFEQIRELPGYFPALTELAIVREHAAAMAQFLGPDCQLIEFGGGSSRQSRILIAQLQPPLYVQVDSAGEAIQEVASGIAQEFPWLNINGVCADYTGSLRLPEFVGVPIRKKAVYLRGQIFGNLTPPEALRLLQLARRTVGSDGAVLAGVYLKKDQPALAAACNDAAGVFAAFNLNLLARINRELGGDFQLQRFRHCATYDRDRGRIEMHLESLASQFAHVGGRRFSFSHGERILTGISCKYGADEFSALAQRAGFSPGEAWADAAGLLSVNGLIAV